jgi:hypothetical protein
MDDDFQDLEAELGRLRPVDPRRDLIRRIGRDIAQPVRAVRGWLWVSIPAAAAIAAAVVLGVRRPGLPDAAPPPAPAVTALRPVAVRDQIVGPLEEGYVMLADGRPARRLRETHLDTIVWKDPLSAASLQWSVPREEVRIFPVSFE